ncbi:hypothetical protein PCANC_03017 [Puccinia coronata f. sp. avenae]|uniref:Methyltransferase small domain-containing protein n=2 Tax=Puccinia coronata f. sp. avenae TaxID=200324 RepID=A0A2N5W1A0_9BASI|nr:hypothetical protein PCASD_04640 [Puccinia coronata f. sp. avenae]PLW55970.1 hypothetical protein PCANC_03017 [Puccinia coronata f. sp. avenae]
MLSRRPGSLSPLATQTNPHIRNCGLLLVHSPLSSTISSGKGDPKVHTQSKRPPDCSSYFTARSAIPLVKQRIVPSRLDSSKATADSLALRWAHTSSPFKTHAGRPAVPTPGTHEQGLKNRLVRMYLKEENLSVATPEHWSRSETELNWLKMGARNELLRQSQKLISPISLNQHIQFQTGRQRLLDELLADWVEQHVSQKKPLAYILGNVPFGNLTFTIRPPILIPRPETEQWVIELSRAMNAYFQTVRASHLSADQFPLPHLSMARTSRPSSFKVLDLGTGSGCISNYLAYHHQDVHAVGVDIDQNAVGLARENALSYKILCPNKSNPTNRQPRGRASFFNLDIFSPTFIQNLKQTSQSLAGFDMIISNPPYIPLHEYHALPQSVKNWESSIALVGDRTSGGLNDPNRSMSRSNRPSGDYGFFTSYRSSLSSSIALEPQLAPDGRSEEYQIGPAGKAETTSGSVGLKGTEGVIQKKDGLDFYRRILQLVATGGLLKSDASNFHHRSGSVGQRLPKLVLEVGHGQASSVKELVLQVLPGVITQVLVVKDFAGIDRSLLCY